MSTYFDMCTACKAKEIIKSMKVPLKKRLVLVYI